MPTKNQDAKKDAPQGLEARIKELEDFAQEARKDRDAAQAEAADLRRELDQLARAKAVLESRIETNDENWQREVHARQGKIEEQANVITELKTRNAQLNTKLADVIAAVEKAAQLKATHRELTRSGGVRQPPAFSAGMMRPGYRPSAPSASPPTPAEATASAD